MKAKEGIINLYNPHFLSHQPTFLSHTLSNKPIVIAPGVTVLLESLGETALLEYLNLTTQYLKGAVFQAMQVLKLYKCDKNIMWVYIITGRLRQEANNHSHFLATSLESIYRVFNPY